MSKKFIATVVALISILALSAFSISNALALESGTNGGTAQPLTSQLCKSLKKNYKRNIETVKAKGLSLSLSQEDVKAMIQYTKEDRDATCVAANDPSTLSRMCKTLRKNYGKDIQRLKESNASQKAIQSLVQHLKQQKKDICAKAKVLSKPTP